MDAVVVAVLSELDGFFYIKRAALKAFPGTQHVLALLRTGFGKTFTRQ